MWLYHRFPLSFREVEELMLAHCRIVSYETIRQWCAGVVNLSGVWLCEGVPGLGRAGAGAAVRPRRAWR